MEINAKILISLFMVIIIGAALTVSLSDSVSKNTKYLSITNDPIQLVTTSNLSLRGTGITNLVVWNATNGTIKTDYNFTVNPGSTIFPSILALNDSTWKNTPLLINYSYYDTNYLSDSNSRSLVGICLIMFVVGIIGIVLYYNKDNFKDLLG